MASSTGSWGEAWGRLAISLWEPRLPTSGSWTPGPQNSDSTKSFFILFLFFGCASQFVGSYFLIKQGSNPG